METRDKLNTLEGYRTRIEELREYIEKGKNDINKLRESEKKGIQLYPLPNNQVIQNKNKTNLNYQFIIFITTYSMGEDIKKLYEQYSIIVSLMETSWKKIGGYVDMVWMLSIGIMLNIEDDTFFKLVKLIEKDNPNDFLMDFLINYRVQEWQKKHDSFMFKRPYQATQEIISLGKNDKTKSLERLKNYLKKEWYRGHSDAGWYNSHKHGIIHFGYWSFESGALVKILGLDDSTLKGLPYYPYDMVHWKEENK